MGFCFVVLFWVIVEFSSGRWNLVFSGPNWASVLGPCGVQFKLMKSILLRTCWGSASGQCGVQFRLTGDGSPHDHVVWLWDIVGFNSGGWNLVSTEPTGASVLGHCKVQFRLMESGLLRTCWELSFRTLWGSVQAHGIWFPQNSLWIHFGAL